jgi:hypothetical protein
MNVAHYHRCPCQLSTSFKIYVGRHIRYVQLFNGFNKKSCRIDASLFRRCAAGENAVDEEVEDLKGGRAENLAYPRPETCMNRAP